MKKSCMLRFIKILILSLFTICVFLQKNYANDAWDVQGKDFWLCFMPNLYSSQNIDTLYIFIAANQVTTGTITYTNPKGVTNTQTFSITNTSNIYTFSLPLETNQIVGLNDSYNSQILSATSSSNQNEAVEKLSFHITSDADITVYAQSRTEHSSDAWLVYPTDVLGNDYYVMSYNSDGTASGSSISTSSTPSQFMIVAPYDNTSIEIIPSVATYKYGTITQNITLNKGEVYLVQANITSSLLNLDLTGSYIHSSNPIAVFGGQQKCIIPASVSTGTRDYIAEQIPPLNMWGEDIIVVPFSQPSNVESDGYYDLYRILIGYDSTEIFINGVSQGIYNKGKFIEKKIDASYHITSSQPVLVAEFKKTASIGSSSSLLLGDPFMMVIPPVEQYMASYKVINAQAWDSGSIIYSEQWITVIFPKEALNTFTIDGTSYVPSKYYSVPNTNYLYAHISSSDGSHSLSSTSNFGILIYGYGQANSYGYVGGMSFKPHDNHNPEILATQNCFNVQGMIYDTAQYDSKISTAVSKNILNTNVNISAFTPYVDSLSFTASLIDKYSDGSFTLMVTDSFGLSTSQYYIIPGFTVRIYSDSAYNYVPTLDTTVQVNTDYCFKYEIQNYGNYSQTVTETQILYNSSKFKIQESFPIIIPAKSSKTITLCYNSSSIETIIDTLILKSDCAERTGLYIYLGPKHDESKPQIFSTQDCFTVSGMIYDTTFYDSKISTASSSNIVNTSVTIPTFKPYVDSLSFTASLVDKYLDGGFTLAVADSFGLSTSKDFAIPGFTVRIKSSNAYDYNPNLDTNVKAKTKYCFYFQLENYGKYNQTIKSGNIMYNSTKLILQETFPITLTPNETKTLTFCYETDIEETLIDTLLIKTDCADRKALSFTIYSQSDKIPPQISINTDSCLSSYLMTITDSLSTDLGIDSIRIDSIYNCTITNNSTSIKVKEVTITINDPSYDSYVAITVVDNNGNQTSKIISIPGFTVEISSSNIDTTNIFKFGTQTIGSLTCDSLKLYNYGTSILTIPDARLFENILYSVPESQFPIIINPKETKYLIICYEPLIYNTEYFRDTLEIPMNCREKYIPIDGLSAEIVAYGATKCEIPVTVTIFQVPKGYILEQNSPNPVGTTAKIIFGLPEKTNAQLLLFDAYGNLRKTIFDSNYSAGIYEIEFSATDLNSGIYFYELIANGNKLVKSMIVIK